VLQGGDAARCERVDGERLVVGQRAEVADVTARRDQQVP